MALAKINDNKITKRQRLAFYQFVINIYTLDIDELLVKYNKLDVDEIEDLKIHGFCYMICEYFGLNMSDYNMETLFPELYIYKPTNCGNDSWWFPLSIEQTERIEIARKILETLR